MATAHSLKPARAAEEKGGTSDCEWQQLGAENGQKVTEAIWIKLENEDDGGMMEKRLRNED